MATKKRPILIRVQPINYQKLKAIADQNSRSISNQLEYLMVQFINKYEKENGAIPPDNDDEVKINITKTARNAYQM